jgi:hypothetical protein
MVEYSPICTSEDVGRYFKFTFDSTSSPSKASVESWIAISSAMIYGAISQIYSIPVHEKDLPILKEICIAYVRDKVNYVNGANVYTNPTLGINAPRTIKLDNFKEYINMLLNGEIKLLNTPMSGSVTAKDYNFTNGIEPESQKEQTLW